MKLLNLNLKKQWYNMIASGEKREEYREIKPYWQKRLQVNGYHKFEFKSFVGVVFIYGYTNQKMSFKLDGISIGKGREEWGAEPGKDYFVIKFSPLI